MLRPSSTFFPAHAVDKGRIRPLKFSYLGRHCKGSMKDYEENSTGFEKGASRFYEECDREGSFNGTKVCNADLWNGDRPQAQLAFTTT